MSGARLPGPTSSDAHDFGLDDGTLVRGLTSRPGPTGSHRSAYVLYEGQIIRVVPAPPGPDAFGPSNRRPVGKGSQRARLSQVSEGSRGDDVRLLQRQLNARTKPSPELAVDGDFGPLTRAAVVRYQGAAGLTPDGIVGPKTWAALLKGAAVVVPPVAVRAAAAPSSPTPKAPAPKAPAPSEPPGVWEWALEDKFVDVLWRTVPKLPGKLKDEFAALLTPTSIGIMAGTLAAWAAAHFFGVGEAIDVVLLVAGLAFLGLAAFDVMEELYDFLHLTIVARSEAELDEAAAHLAKAISIMGVVAFMALLAKVGSAKAKGAGKAIDKKGEAYRAGRSKGGAAKGGSATPAGGAKYVTAEEAPFVKKPLPKGELEPGAVRGAVSPTLNEMPTVPEGFPNIKAADVNTFSTTPNAEVLEPGTKLYRFVGDGSNSSGSFWTREMPVTEAEWRSGAAVKGEWNGDGGYVEYTVPEGGMPAWTGTAAPQPSSVEGYILSGGGDQVWIPANTVTPSAPMPSPWTPSP